MNAENQAAADATPAAAVAAPKEIIRGRMPVAIVHLVRYGSLKDQSTKAKADAFGTTVGKVDDIAKGRNFNYVTEDFRPTEQQKVEGKAWLERHPTGAADLIAELEAVPVATIEEAQAFDIARSAARGQAAPAASEDGAPADAGGGNRRSRSKKKDEPAADGDALLS
jgi:hypothetical protein